MGNNVINWIFGLAEVDGEGGELGGGVAWRKCNSDELTDRQRNSGRDGLD